MLPLQKPQVGPIVLETKSVLILSILSQNLNVGLLNLASRTNFRKAHTCNTKRTLLNLRTKAQENTVWTYHSYVLESKLEYLPCQYIGNARIWVSYSLNNIRKKAVLRKHSLQLII